MCDHQAPQFGAIICFFGTTESKNWSAVGKEVQEREGGVARTVHSRR
jgi:hypothetical protein